jgi:hypothetical protein
MEYYGYQSLADLFVFESMDIGVWRSVINRIFEISGEFAKHQRHVPYADFESMYISKTAERLAEMEKIPWWKKIFARDTVTVNGKKMLNLPHFREKIANEVKKLYRKADIGVIHGDLCLGNILFDPGSRIIKFIDPRGRFGSTLLYGDLKYDMAKLRHSISGKYDFIVGDLFEVSHSPQNEFSLSVYSEPHNDVLAEVFDRELVRNGFRLREIKLIEALLFLSMLPLHSDSDNRQKAMYLRGIELLNELK